MSPQPPEDLTHDGALLKTILTTAPDDASSATRGAKVSLRYSLHLTDDIDTPPLDSSAKRRHGLLAFTLGKNKVVPALELVAQSMRKGERCVVRVAPTYALGLRGLRKRGVEKGRELYLYVEMVDVDGGELVKGMLEMTSKERFEHAAACKEVGNGFFKEQKFDKALAQYRMAIRYLANVFYKVDGRGFGGEGALKKGENGFVEASVREGEGEKGEEATDKWNDEVSDKTENMNGSAVDVGAKSDEVVEEIDLSTATHPQGSTQEGTNSTGGEEGLAQAASEEVKEKEEKGEDEAQAANKIAVEGERLEADDPDEKEVRSLHVTTLNNLSLCFVKLENYRQAVESASMALNLDPESSKALYYR